MKYFCLVLIIFLLSCNKNELVEGEFKNVVIKYQNEFPIEVPDDIKFTAYVGVLDLNHGDTLFYIFRTIDKENKFNSYELFEDDELKPFILFDLDSVGADFAKVEKKNKGTLLSIFWRNSLGQSGFTPKYWYHFKNGKMKFIYSDTIRM